MVSSIHIYNVRIKNPCYCVLSCINHYFKYSALKTVIPEKRILQQTAKIYSNQVIKATQKTKIGLNMIMMKVDTNRSIDDKEWAGVTNVIVNISLIYPGWYIIALSPTEGNNSSPHSAASMRQWVVLALLQIMACRPYGTKPLSEPMLVHYQLNPWE